MRAFKVWAPNAEEVALEIAAGRVPMQRDESGWWTVTHAAPHGARYRFRLGESAALPDPRSGWQPEGVEGPSAVVDHDSFSWSDAGWQPPDWRSAVVYELHVGTFTPAGTYAAARQRLDHLVALGITHVELMPLNAFSGNHGWGYDGVFFFAPQHSYGTPDDLKRFVDACHARGLAVLLDVVYNHLGPVGNYLPQFGPYLTDRHKTTWGASLNFDGAHSDEVRRFICDNACMWLRDYHFDGLRLDATQQLIDTRAVHILEELAGTVRRLEQEIGRPLVLIAENDQNDPRLAWPVERGGCGLDAIWLDDFHHALHTLLTGEQKGYYADYGGLATFAKTWQTAFVYDGCPSRNRHRTHGRPATGLSGDNFVVCMQNHDQIGNRALGDRMGQSISVDRLKVGAALLLTAPFVPLLFQGEEWSADSPFLYFTDHADPKFGDAVRQGRRAEFAEFGWDPDEIPDPQARETFQRSKLDWTELNKSPHQDVLNWYRRLIALRRATTDLHAGAFQLGTARFDERQDWIVLERGATLIAANLSRSQRTIPMTATITECVLSSQPVQVDAGELKLAPDSVAILRVAEH
jgi:maltooligosyltrehalose trehalohydrolase